VLIVGHHHHRFFEAREVPKARQRMIVCVHA
jgi:hypothetical protein